MSTNAEHIRELIPDAQTLQTRRAAIRAAIDELPSLPASVFELNSVLSASPVDLKRVCAVIRTDPSLAAQVIRLCNSPLFWFPDRVFTIEEAVVMLGTDRIRTLVLGCRMLEYVAQELPGSSILSFWQHSILTAGLSRRIALFQGQPDAEHAYVAGLLHDLGLLPILLFAARNAPQAPVPCFEGRAGDSLDCERVMFGADHCEIGRQLGIAWGFPPSLIEVLAHHHDSQAAPHSRELVATVAAADRYCQVRGVVLAIPTHGLAVKPAQDCEDVLRDCLPSLTQTKRGLIAQGLEEEFTHFTERQEWNIGPLVTASRARCQARGKA